LRLQPVLRAGLPVGIHVHNRDEMFLQRGGEVRRGAASTAADLGDADLLTGVGGAEDVERCGGQHPGGERRLFDEGAAGRIIFHENSWLMLSGINQNGTLWPAEIPKLFTG